MSRDGNGNYNRVPGSSYPNGTIADGPEIDAEMADIATALTQSLSKDGQTVATANLPMGGYRHTNVDDAAARTDYARADQVQDCVFSTLSSVSGADTITATAALSMAAYVSGQKFSFVSAGANTGAVTLNINGLGVKNVTKQGTTALAAGDIASGAVVVVQYDGTQFQIVSGAPDADAVKVTGAQTVAGVKTFSSSPIVPAPTTGLQASTKDYVDTTSAAAAAAAVVPATLAPTLLVAGTAIPTTSGTSINLSLVVPSWARRLTVVLDQISLSSTSSLLVQIGDSGGFETTGYASSSTGTTGTGGGLVSSAAGFIIRFNSAALAVSGHMILTHAGGNTWVSSHSVGESAVCMVGGGSKTLSGTLDSIRITTVSGTDAFDAGQCVLMWE